MRRLGRAGLAIALGAALLLASLAFAQQGGVIEGVVANGTTGEVVGGAPVSVVALRAGTQVARRDAVADGQGRFRFDGLQATPGLRYIVGTQYLGAEYTADAGELVSAAGPVRLSVFETTTSDEAITILRASMAVPSIDRETALIQVLEVVTFTNRGNRTYVGDLFSRPGQGGVLRVSLPREALDVALGDGFGADPLPAREGLLTRAPVPPGQFALVYAYKVPFTDRVYTLERSFTYPVDRATFLIAVSGPRPSSPRLINVETVDVNGVKNFSLSARQVQPGEKLTVTLSGLPPLAAPASRGGGVNLDTALRGAGIGLMALLLAGLVVYTVGWRRRRPSAAADGVLEADALRAEQQALVSSLADLDTEFEAGRLSREEYEAARRRQRQRLIDVLLLVKERSGGERHERRT